MDILQQSLQAADILSGEDNDDLFGELGLSFNNTSTENIGLPSELDALASQGDALYNNGNRSSSQPTFEDFENANDPTGLSNFDTSQFLNTSAPVNAATMSQTQHSAQQTVGYMSQSNYQQQTRINSLNSTRQQPYENAPLVQYTAQSSTTASHTNHYQSVLHAPTSTVPQKPLQRNVPVLHPASVQPSEMSRAVTTVAQSIAVATCNSVFLKAPTQSLASSVQMNSATQPFNISRTSMVQTELPGSMQLSAPLQIVQSSSTLAQHGQRQLVTLVQKPMVIQVSLPSNQVQPSAQLINGIAVQPQQQNHNVAVVKIAGTNRALNLNDPKVVKALTANLLQKQQVETQTGQQPQQQVFKLGQTNAVFNVVPQRPQQPPAVLRGAQQITLQNGQTILLNNGQQMQICTTQSQAGQIQVLQPGASVQTVVAGRRTHHQTATGGGVQATRNGQLAFKGIQIASVSVPIASSSITNVAANISSVQGNVVAIPVVAQSMTTSSSMGTTEVNSVTVTQANTLQMPSSSTVRSLLANAILRQNNVSTNNGNTSSVSPLRMNSASNATAVNGQVANTGQTQVPTMLRLNLTSQQVAQLTPAQLQSILKQHQLPVQARPAANSNTITTAKGTTTMVAQESFEKTMQTPQSSVTPVLKTSASVTTSANSSKPSSGEQPAIQVYKVEPTLTEAQVDEVKKFLTNRTIGSKLNNLTREQQQLVLAFQAQLKTMSSPVQQYYLRNPQLFMQKVLQHIRAGKPYILQVKVDTQQKPRIVSTVTTQKSQHPTISLTQDPNRANNRVNLSSPATVSAELAKQITPSDTPSAKPAQITMKPTVTLQVPTHVAMRPLPEPPAKVSLVLEQLDCHKKMVTVPDCTHPFKSVRDAIRRLVPFHTCNIPNVKEDHFLESERMFDQISDRIAARTKTMVNKYHLLCLRDSTRDSCSAEMVMIERMFLQKEKVKLAEDKARLRDDPSLIREYFPHHISNETKSVKSYDGDKSRYETNSENISISSAYDKDQSAESPISNDDTSALSIISECSSDLRTSSKGRYYSHDSSGGPSSAKRLKHTSSDNSESEDMLLQEAVGSILT